MQEDQFNSYLIEDYKSKITQDINNNIFDKKINEGAYSNIFAFNTTMVLKKIKNNSSNLLSNISEIEILKRLQNKNIIKCYGFYYNQGLIFILERYDCTLNDYKIKNSHEIDYIINEIRNGLLFLHSNMYLHLDIKPENILIKKYKDNINVCITDFSLSKKTKNLTFISIFELISPYYRPYENLKGSIIYSDKSDLWSLGIIMYELKTGIKMSERVEIENLRLYYDCEYTWKRWPPIGYDYLNENPLKRTSNSIQNIKYENVLDNHFTNDYFFILSTIFPSNIISDYINETIILYNSLVNILNINMNILLISCFVIVYSNYNDFSILIRYYNIYELKPIFTILCSV